MRLGVAPAVGISLMLIGGCTETVTHRQKVPTSFGDVYLVVTSVGTAVDGERYELKFKNGSNEQTFFKGWNFTEFHLQEREGKVQIQMCHGWIERAEPISVGEPEDSKLVRLNIDWNCLDKRHDA